MAMAMAFMVCRREKAKRPKERLGSERRGCISLTHCRITVVDPDFWGTLQVGSAGLGWYTLHIVVAQSLAVAAENQEIGYDDRSDSKFEAQHGAGVPLPLGGSPDGKDL